MTALVVQTLQYYRASSGDSAAQNRARSWLNTKKQTNQSWGSIDSTAEALLALLPAQKNAVPEEFWVDKKQCRYTNLNGETQNPTQQACAEGISAVKAIAIAQQQGQKIYTINKDNRNTALPKLKEPLRNSAYC